MRAATPPQFAIVQRDGLAIMLRRVQTPALISPNEKQGGTWDAFFWVRDADALFAEFREKGADVVYEPIVREYDRANSPFATAADTSSDSGRTSAAGRSRVDGDYCDETCAIAGVVCAVLFCGSAAFADTYPRQPGVDAFHYVFRLDISDTRPEIVGDATVDCCSCATSHRIALDLRLRAAGKGWRCLA